MTASLSIVLRGLGVTAEQVIRGATLILLPLIPSSLSIRAGEELTAHLDARRKRAPPVMAVFNMVDRRRSAHRDALIEAPDRPAIPMASAIERMADRHAPVGAYAPRAPVTKAILALSTRIEQSLIKPRQRLE